MRTDNDEIVKKHGFISATFKDDNGNTVVRSNISLRDVKHYRHDFNIIKNDYIAFGLTFENMRKILTFRAPFTINNLTCF